MKLTGNALIGAARRLSSRLKTGKKRYSHVSVTLANGAVYKNDSAVKLGKFLVAAGLVNT